MQSCNEVIAKQVLALDSNRGQPILQVDDGSEEQAHLTVSPTVTIAQTTDEENQNATYVAIRQHFEVDMSQCRCSTQNNF